MAKATTRAPKTPRAAAERVDRAATSGRITKHQGQTATIAPSAATAAVETAAALQPSASFGGHRTAATTANAMQPSASLEYDDDDYHYGRANRFGAPAPFQRATNGTEERLSWARSAYGGGAFGFGAYGPVYYNLLGGRTAREQGPAAAVATALSTSNPVIAALTLNLSTQALGQGLTLTAKPNAKALGITPEQGRELSKALESAFSEWADDPLECDWTGRFPLSQIANAHFLSAIHSGEAVTVFEWEDFGETKYKTKLKLLDPTQLDRTLKRHDAYNLNVSYGVCTTQAGRIVGYMLHDVPLGSRANAPAAKYVPARSSWGRIKVLHTYQFIDPQQVRGLSPLVSALTPAHERETLGEFVLGKAFLDNSFAISVESNLPTAQALDGLQVNDVAGHTENWLAMREQIYGKAKITPQPGTINHLAPGDKLHFHKSETPNNTFDSFDRSLVRKAAKAAGSSVEDVSGDFSQTSFSASRWAAGLPHEINLVRRKNICEHLYRAAYEAFVEEAIERELIELPPNAPPFSRETKKAYCGAKFLGKGMIQPDPKKSAEAQLMRMENGLATFAEIIGEEGKDLETHIEALVAERDLLAKHGLNQPFYVGQTTTQKRLSAEDVEDEPQPTKPTKTKPEPQPAKPKTRRRSAKANLVVLEPYEPEGLSADEALAL